MADVKNGAVLSGVHVRRDVTVFVLDRHAPTGKLHHLSSMCPVEIKQRSLLQGSLEGDEDTEVKNKLLHLGQQRESSVEPNP